MKRTITGPGTLKFDADEITGLDNVQGLSMISPLVVAGVTPNIQLIAPDLNGTSKLGLQYVVIPSPNSIIGTGVGVPLTFAPGGTQTLKMLPTGIPHVFNQEQVLVMDTTNPVPELGFKILSAGTYAPVFTPTVGFANVGTMRTMFTRSGQVVDVNMSFTADLVAGANTATFDLPYPPSAPFAVGQDLVGIVSAPSLGGTSDLFTNANTGTNLGVVTINSSLGQAATRLALQFKYVI